MAAVLETKGLCKSFGALPVASDIDFRLENGARHALIGPNGAGKTSFVNLVTGATDEIDSSFLEFGEITGLKAAPAESVSRLWPIRLAQGRRCQGCGGGSQGARSC